MTASGGPTVEALASTEPDADARSSVREPSAGELAWIATLPCTLVILLAVLALGPPLGRLVFPSTHEAFWPDVASIAGAPHPEPTEHARFLLALTAPLLLAGCIFLAPRRLGPLKGSTIRVLVLASQLMLTAFVIACVVVQDRYRFSLEFSASVVYFTPATLAAAGILTAAFAALLASARGMRIAAAALCETRARRIAGAVVACAAAFVWILPAVNLEATIGGANEAVLEHMQVWLDEAFALLDGRFPLVDFVAQYASLWPFPVAAAMSLFGASVGVFTITMSAISVVTTLAVFATFRRVARTTPAALLLFLPVLATGYFMMEGSLENRYAMDNLFSVFPARYAGPLLLMWLLARALDGARPRRRWPLFLAAGLVAINNVEFGIPAFGATVLALLLADGAPRAPGLRRLVLEVVVGFFAAIVVVSVLTLVVAGSLPHFSLMFYFSRLFAVSGFGLVPMNPLIGLSTVIFLTYVTAVGLAAVRAANREPDRLLTGLLAWSGIFGLGIGSYYMGRSHPEVLVNMFAAWALAVALLTVAIVRALLARPRRRMRVEEFACLFAFAVMTCSLAQTPMPWTELARLDRTGDSIYAQPEGQPFVAAHTRPGESVAILTLLGHRVAYAIGVTDVLPFSGGSAMPAVRQLDKALEVLREARGRKVFLSARTEWVGMPEALEQRGYRTVAREAYGMVEYVSSPSSSR